MKQYFCFRVESYESYEAGQIISLIRSSIVLTGTQEAKIDCGQNYSKNETSVQTAQPQKLQTLKVTRLKHFLVCLYQLGT